jgi:transcriptional regulator with XRE-family HTH domain
MLTIQLLRRRLKEVRTRAGLSAEVLAEKIRAAGYATSIKTVYNNEGGPNQSIDLFYLLALCQATGTTLAELTDVSGGDAR